MHRAVTLWIDDDLEDWSVQRQAGVRVLAVNALVHIIRVKTAVAIVFCMGVHTPTFSKDISATWSRDWMHV